MNASYLPASVNYATETVTIDYDGKGTNVQVLQYKRCQMCGRYSYWEAPFELEPEHCCRA